MARPFVAAVLIVSGLLGGTPAEAGTMVKRKFDCALRVQLWEVEWWGPWDTDFALRLEKSTTNLGPWQPVLQKAPEAGCIHPATNLRWYRIGKSVGLGNFELASVWVPKWFCRDTIPN